MPLLMTSAGRPRSSPALVFSRQLSLSLLSVAVLLLLWWGVTALGLIAPLFLRFAAGNRAAASNPIRHLSNDVSMS